MVIRCIGIKMFTWMSLLVMATAVSAAANTSDTLPALRILTLGASVTFGVGSTTGNSYRKSLRDFLTHAGHTVNFVGRRRNGDFTDNQVEATSGFVISQISEAARVATPMFLPNLVLIEAGTNNCNSGSNVPTAGQNVSEMIDFVYQSSPGVTVILATILQNKDAGQDSCRVDINRQYKEVLAPKYEADKAKFVLVDMRSADGPTTADLFDSRHPNDVGYGKMGVVWAKGIELALGKGFITAPDMGNGIPLDGDSESGSPGGSGSGTGSGGVGGSMMRQGQGQRSGSPVAVQDGSGVSSVGSLSCVGSFLLGPLFVFLSSRLLH